MGQTRKNILLVSFDDACAPWPYRTAFGEPLRLPTLESLCEVATTFQTAYAQAPICGPSRASMMTGRRPDDLGITTNGRFVFDVVPPTDCFVRDLRDAGYFCSSGGKVHHMVTLRRPHHREIYSDARKAFSDDRRFPRPLRKQSIAYGGFRFGRSLPDGLAEDFFFDHQAADSAIAFLQDHDGTAPFYREVGFASPHSPFLTPARFREIYDPAKFHRPEEWQGYVADNPFVTENIKENEAFRDERFWQESVRNYFSSYSQADFHFGRVLAALRASRHARNTVIIVLSDHGWHLGNRNLFRKTTLWEQSLHVPLIIFDPDDPSPRVVTDPVGLIDLAPTIADYAGLPAREAWAGQSLRGMMMGGRDPDRILPSFYAQGASIRRGDYRLIRYGDGSHQLFDVVQDYWQLRDLGSDHPAFAPMQQALVETVGEWRAAPDQAADWGEGGDGE